MTGPNTRRKDEQLLNIFDVFEWNRILKTFKTFSKVLEHPDFSIKKNEIQAV